MQIAYRIFKILSLFDRTLSNETQPDGSLRSPYLVQVNIYNPAPGSYSIVDTLDQYRNHIAAVSIPITVLSLEILGLLLFFVALMIQLLVERQEEAIALLRSRGASSGQIFTALLTQSASLSIMAMLTGPVLAVLLVSAISERFLGTAGQHVFSPGTFSLLSQAVGVGMYALGTAVLVVVVTIFLLFRALGLNILLARREAARATQPSLWQRLNLDRLAALVALTGYGMSFYISSLSTWLDTRTRALIATPLALVAPLFLLIAVLLLFLRGFPLLLRWGARLSAQGRGATAILALAQMARAPRQALRMILLLALAVAFAIFTLVFAASQSAHIANIAAYETGADFSGDRPILAQQIDQLPSISQETARYQHIAGVLSATVGFTDTATSAGTSPIIPLQIRAVDASTFAQTAIWTPEDSSQPLTSLMAQLLAQKQDVLNGSLNDTVPVIIDAEVMNTLDLKTGSTFSVTMNNLPYDSLNCVVIATVWHIPTINNSGDGSTTGDTTLPGGVLLDYSTYASIYTRDYLRSGLIAHPYLPVNHVWLHTSDDPVALTNVRSVLVQPGPLHLDNLYDRQQLIESMRSDPLYLSIIILLVTGATTALLLTLVGDLLSSWMSVRSRLTGFAVLRSLGAAPRQIIAVLFWEQGIIYMTALVLGILFGGVFSATAIPLLTFTTAPAGSALSGISNDEFYAIQQIIPVQIILPLSLVLAFIAFIAICALTLGTMAGVAVRPSLSQVLRLNQD